MYLPINFLMQMTYINMRSHACARRRRAHRPPLLACAPPTLDQRARRWKVLPETLLEYTGSKI